jgi:hypothetical protein
MGRAAPPSGQNVVLLGLARGICVPNMRMVNVVLSTLALLACALLIYVFFHWLREELNPKRPTKPYPRHAPTQAPLRPYLMRPRSSRSS